MTSEGICERCHQPVPSHYLIKFEGYRGEPGLADEEPPATLPDFRTEEDIDRIFSAADEAEAELLGEEDRLLGDDADSLEGDDE